MDTKTPVTEAIARTGRGTTPEADADGAGDPLAWPDVERYLRAGEGTTWLSVRSEDGVHTRPLFAAWTGTSFVLASKAAAVKSRHLDRETRASLAVHLDRAHLVVECGVRRLASADDLARAREAFDEVYDWPTTVVGEELDAPYAAPTSGGPPFRVYELTPARAHAFPTDDSFAPTRYRFTR